MKYNKDNIDGLTFKCRLSIDEFSPTIYKIDLKQKRQVTWETLTGKYSSWYSINEIIRNLNNGISWVVCSEQSNYLIFN